jgi:three-Cys-motif partner protein
MPDIEHYRGREQGYIKHALIEKYLESFTIKIGSGWDEIVYIDAFAGPWGAKATDLSDTSFGIALERLERGLKVLREVHKRSPRIRAFLIEKDAKAFRKLDAFIQSYRSKGIEVGGLSGEFQDHVPELDRLTRAGRCFLFSLIDPKGWTGLSMAVIAPLIRRRSSEVLVNVMSSFVHRFADVELCRESYEDYFGRPGVRDIISGAPKEDRQDVVVREYCRSLRQHCGYQHVSSCVVMEPDKKGVKYFMVFATNDPMGIKVFKEAEAHAASLQDEIKFTKEFGDQIPLFSSESIEPVSESLRRKYRALAFARVEELFQDKSEATYSDVFCKAMAMPLVTEQELVEFLGNHPKLELRLDGPRRQKPNIQKEDRVVKIAR